MKFKKGDIVKPIINTIQSIKFEILEAKNGRYEMVNLSNNNIISNSVCAMDNYYEKEVVVVVSTRVGECKHSNKRTVDLLTTSYWYCPDCKKDLGDYKK